MLEPDILASTIKKHRKAAGLSQLHLADLAGVGKTIVINIEKGKESIHLDSLRKVLNVLNIKTLLISPLIEQATNNENSVS
jgi:y4mF family transcriptional regulator